MKIGQVTTLIFALILGFSMFFMGVQAEDTISHTDPAGDYVVEGTPTVPPGNVDILSLSMDQSSDPIVIEMVVAGMVVYEGASGLIYEYLIDLNQDSNGDPETSIAVNNLFSTIITDYGTGSVYTFGLEGNGTNTLHLEIDKADIEADVNPILQIDGEAIVSDLFTWTIEDDINENFGGTDPVDDDSDDDDTDDDDPNDDMDDDDTDDNIIPDPLKETPTDKSIGVSIGELEFYADKGDDSFEMETSVDGNTEGDVHHCSFTMVTYYKDGTYEAQEWTDGPEDQPRQTLLGMSFEMYLKGKGPNGNDDWSTWGILIFASGPASLYDEMMDAPIDDEGDMEDIESVHYVVRAYSDEDETMWNQDSKEIKDEITDYWLGTSSSDENGLPTPGILFFIGSILIVASASIIGKGRKRN